MPLTWLQKGARVEEPSISWPWQPVHTLGVTSAFLGTGSFVECGWCDLCGLFEERVSLNFGGDQHLLGEGSSNVGRET